MITTKILCIDDDSMFGVLAQHIFRGIDPTIEVIIKDNALSGLSYLKNAGSYDCPQIVLLDVNMPTGGGFEFLENYRKHGLEGNRSTFYLVSSTVFPEDQRRADEDYLVKNIYTKPFSRQNAEEIINKTFNKSY